MHEEKGVKFELSAGVREFVGEDGKVHKLYTQLGCCTLCGTQIKSVTLPSGKVLEADICVVGVGVVPATDFLKGSGVPMSERGEVIVNEVIML